MSRNKAQGFEEVNSGDELYIFKGDFGFLMSLKEMSPVDPIAIAEHVAHLDPEHIRNVLMASLRKRDNIESDDMAEEDIQATIEDLITRHGLQECGILAQHILSHAMIGDLKKNALDRHENVQSLLNDLVVSRSKSFRNHALLWGYSLMIFGIFQCMSIKLLGLPTILN